MNRLPGGWWHVVALVLVLTSVAALAPEPWYQTDREHYQELGRDIVQQDCSSLHCSRALLAAIIERLPGPSIPKWKAFAVIGNVWAAGAVGILSLQLGLTPTAAVLALWLSGLGFGGLFTLFDPYSADPLMFALGPVLTTLLSRGRLETAGVLSAIGVFAKEFAAAPLWIATAAAALARRWFEALRTGTVAFAVTTLWLMLQVGLVVGFNYSYGGNPSADLLGGGYIVHWFRELGARVALGALLTEYGPLYVLIPAGFLLAPLPLKRLACASVPALLAFMYVQQPDRALWNFHFVATPLAAIVLERASIAWVLALLGSFAVANLRLAAQLQFLPAARYALALSMLIALALVVKAWLRRLPMKAIAPASVFEARTFPAAYRGLLTASIVLAAFALLLVADVAAHKAVERSGGLNRHGYRGDVMKAKPVGQLRVIIAGGATAFSPDVGFYQSLGFVLERFLGQRWRWKEEFVAAAVANVSLPNETAAGVVETLRHFEYLDGDIVCLITGHNDLPGALTSQEGRAASLTFRVAGYLPALPSFIVGKSMVPPAPVLPVDTAWIRTSRPELVGPPTPGACADDWRAYCDAVAAAVDDALSRGRRVIVISEPYVSEQHFSQQRALAGMMANRYSGEARVKHIDLGWALDRLDPSVMADGWRLTPRGIEQYAEGIFEGVFAMVTGS
jgi:hypothetical protein